MKGREDIEASLKFAARAALDQGVSLDDLSESLRAAYAEEGRTWKKKDVSKGEHIEEVRVGSFVTYVDEKKGPLMAHVLEVHEGNRLDLRVHQIAKEDFDRKNVGYSAKRKKNHWSYGWT